MKKITLFALSLAVLAGCAQKENITPEQKSGSKIRLTISLDFPESSPDSKVTLDYSDTTLAWTGDETLSVLVGKKATTTTNAASGLQIPLQSVAPGVFSGEIDLGEFTVEDIQGISVPAENGTYFGYNSSSYRIIMPIAATQTQTVNGIFNPVHVPFFSRFTVDSLGVADASGAYTVSDLKLYSGTDLLRFNIYGTNPDMGADEVLKSIKVTANNKIVGESRWTLDQDGLGSGGGSSVTVNYEGGETIADKTKENGIKVFASIILGGSRTFTEIEITTDKGVYTKTISNAISATTSRHNLKVHNIGIDLSTFNKIHANLEYSVDGGSSWVSTLPLELEGTLAVRGTLTSADLMAIKTLIDAQTAEPVALDLSQGQYESTTFSTTFRENKNLKSIKFPSNVNALPAEVLENCSSLESVDLKGIVTIGDQAFASSGLKSIRLDNTITSMGVQVCMNCYEMEDLYFNVKSSAYDTSKDIGLIRWPNQTTKAHSKDLTVTIGPDATLPRYSLCDNQNVVKIIFEYVGTKELFVGNNAFNRTRYLHTVVCKSASGPVYGTFHADMGKNVAADMKKYLVVPDGSTETYKNHRTTGDTPKGLYNHLNKKCGFEIIEQSAYDAL